MPEKLGIIAGSGQFPALVARQAAARGIQVFVLGFHGFTDQDFSGTDLHLHMLHLGQFNKALAFFRNNGVDKLCMAGGIGKIRALGLRPDALAVRLVFNLKNKGDDSLLRTFAAEIEKQGIQLVSAVDYLPDLRCLPGVLTRTKPNSEIMSDVEFAWPIAQSLGRHDIGQCLVVRQGVIVALECLEGTDATLARGAELGGKGCVAVKISKPGQDQRLDLPSIGLQTVRNLVAGGYRALALEAGKTLFFDQQAALQHADKHKLCIVALDSNFGMI